MWPTCDADEIWMALLNGMQNVFENTTVDNSVLINLFPARGYAFIAQVEPGVLICAQLKQKQNFQDVLSTDQRNGIFSYHNTCNVCYAFRWAQQLCVLDIFVASIGVLRNF